MITATLATCLHGEYSRGYFNLINPPLATAYLRLLCHQYPALLRRTLFSSGPNCESSRWSPGSSANRRPGCNSTKDLIKLITLPFSRYGDEKFFGNKADENDIYSLLKGHFWYLS